MIKQTYTSKKKNSKLPAIAAPTMSKHPTQNPIKLNNASFITSSKSHILVHGHYVLVDGVLHTSSGD